LAVGEMGEIKKLGKNHVRGRDFLMPNAPGSIMMMMMMMMMMMIMAVIVQEYIT
jgi:hypothetical protein